LNLAQPLLPRVRCGSNGCAGMNRGNQDDRRRREKALPSDERFHPQARRGKFGRGLLSYRAVMVTQTNLKQSSYEQALILDKDETEEQVLADEVQWDTQFAATQDGLKTMADKVRAAVRAGRTAPMIFTEDGRIAPG